MKLKRKYIIGMVITSMLFSIPTTSSADEEVIIFGGEFDDDISNVNQSTQNVNNEQQITQVENEPNNEINDDSIENENQPLNENINVNNSNNADYTNNIDDNDVTNIDITINDDENLDDDNYSMDEDINFYMGNENDIDINDQKKSISNLPSNDNKEIKISKNTETDNLNKDIVQKNIDNISNKTPDKPQISKHDNVNKKKSKIDDDNNNDITKNSSKNSNTDKYNQGNQTKQNNKNLRFIKLTSDDVYDYYLDRSTVRWVNMPYSTTEYMADVWIRMIEKIPNNNDMPEDLYNYVNRDSNDELDSYSTKGIINEEDIKVLRHKKYFLEHYYIRPKTQQIQFLCELEVVGRPQNSISERAYDYKNWENLIPGSIEFSLYHGILSNIDKGKASKRGHMTFADHVEEYARISIR